MLLHEEHRTNFQWCLFANLFAEIFDTLIRKKIHLKNTTYPVITQLQTQDLPSKSVLFNVILFPEELSASSTHKKVDPKMFEEDFQNESVSVFQDSEI